jgi:hypothetical protein
MKFFLVSLILSLLLYSCDNYSSKGQGLYEQLEGTWKVDGKETYESWTRINEDSLSGIGYQIINGSTKASEYLSLSVQSSQVIYEAMVPSQNEGRRIPFIQINTDTCHVFENKTHDFPKRIEYCFYGEDSLIVNVSGNQDQKFAIAFLRQPN